MRLDSLALYLEIYPEEEAVRRAFEIVDRTAFDVREISGVEVDKVETILYDGKEYHRKDYFKPSLV